MKVLSIRNTTFFTGTKTDPVNRRYKSGKLDTLKSVRSTSGNEQDIDVTSLTSPRSWKRFRKNEALFVVISMRVCSSSCVVYLLYHMLYAESDVANIMTHPGAFAQRVILLCLRPYISG